MRDCKSLFICSSTYPAEHGEQQGDQLSVATDGLDSLFGQARETLDILDDEVEALIQDSNFVATYFEARKTTDRKARTAGETETPVV